MIDMCSHGVTAQRRSADLMIEVEDLEPFEAKKQQHPRGGGWAAGSSAALEGAFVAALS